MRSGTQALIVSRMSHWVLKTAIASTLLVCAGGLRAQDVPPGHTWVSYENSRFGFKVGYPADIFTPGQPPANNDGRRFNSRDVAAHFTASAGFNMEDWTSASQYLAHLLKSDGYEQVTHKSSGKDWLVLSGVRGQDIYYEKYIFSCNFAVINALRIIYPKTAANLYSLMIRGFVRNFVSGKGYDTPEECS